MVTESDGPEKKENVLESIAGDLAILAIKETLAEGKYLHFAGTDIVITPDGFKTISELTEDEMRNNPHIPHTG